MVSKVRVRVLDANIEFEALLLVDTGLRYRIVQATQGINRKRGARRLR
jgi:hypothetical protein